MSDPTTGRREESITPSHRLVALIRAVTKQQLMQNHTIMTEELVPSSMDEFVQVEDLNQGEHVTVVLESTIAADERSVATTKVQEDRTTGLQETISPLTTDIDPVSGVKVNEILQSILNEIKSVKEDVHSAEANITGAVTELKSLKEEMKSLNMLMEGSFANLTVVKEESNNACDEKIETGVDIPESDTMRRINIIVTNNKAHRVLINQDFFEKSGDYVTKVDIASYITSALEAFQRGEGKLLPTNVMYWPFYRGTSMEPSILFQKLKSEEQDAKCQQFQDMVVNHLHLLVGSKPRIERDAQGQLVMFCE